MKKLATKSEFARLTGRKPSQITNFIERGMPMRGGKIPVVEARRWIAENISPRTTRGAGRSKHGRGKVAEEREVLRQRAERLRLENAERRGELVNAADVFHEYSCMIANCRSRLLLLPGQLAPILASVSDVFEIQETIRKAVYEALTELARYQPQDDAKK